MVAAMSHAQTTSGPASVDKLGPLAADASSVHFSLVLFATAMLSRSVSHVTARTARVDTRSSLEEHFAEPS